MIYETARLVTIRVFMAGNVSVAELEDIRCKLKAWLLRDVESSSLSEMHLPLFVVASGYDHARHALKSTTCRPLTTQALPELRDARESMSEDLHEVFDLIATCKPNEIATVIARTPHFVRQQLHEIRRHCKALGLSQHLPKYVMK